MSRTTRHIPFHMRGIQPWQATLIGLGNTDYATHDPRDRLANGYDDRRGQSLLYHPGDRYNDGDWRLSAKSRRCYKQWKARNNRRKWSAMINRELRELEIER